MVIMAPSYLQVLAAVVAVRAAGNDDLAAWHASCYYIPGSRAFYTVHGRSQQVPSKHHTPLVFLPWCRNE